MLDRTNLIADVKENKEQNGIEIYFRVYPIEGTRNTLKDNGFRWNHKKSCWYAKYSVDRQIIAEVIADTLIEEYKEIAGENGEQVQEVKTATTTKKATKKATKNAAKVNKYGIKVGDFFGMSWGWEQTNVNFFQVVELVGECSARVKEVYPEIIDTIPTCSMAEDRVYKFDRSKIAPVKTSSIFVNDQDRGDLKKICVNNYHNEPRYYINFDKGYYHAYLETEETSKVYVSWYA